MINSAHFPLEKIYTTYWSMISILFLYTSISIFLEILFTAAEKKKKITFTDISWEGKMANW